MVHPIIGFGSKRICPGYYVTVLSVCAPQRSPKEKIIAQLDEKASMEVECVCTPCDVRYQHKFDPLYFFYNHEGFWKE